MERSSLGVENAVSMSVEQSLGPKAGSEWRGVTPGHDLGLAKNCTIPRAIPLAWRGVTLSTCEEFDRNGSIPKQFWERGRGIAYSAVVASDVFSE